MTANDGRDQDYWRTVAWAVWQTWRAPIIGALCAGLALWLWSR